MHIITGLLLSKLFASSGQQRKFKGFRGIIEVKHSMPGRIRFCIPVLKMEMEKGHLLEQQLLKAEAIHQIKVNPLLGSLLIVYDAEKLDEVTLTGVLAKLLGLEKELEKTPRSVLGQELSKVLKSANTTIYERTDGLLDLNSAIALGFFSMGIWSLIRRSSLLPAGISLLYWAYNSSMQSFDESTLK